MRNSELSPSPWSFEKRYFSKISTKVYSENNHSKREPYVGLDEVFIRDANGRMIFKSRHIHSKHTDKEFFNKTSSVVEANARLIASAPELLSALERLAFAAECRDNTSGDPLRLIAVKAELADAARHANEVIAKATGVTK